MRLGELIEYLENIDQHLVVKKGFCNPHSYRGHYEELAFQPTENITVGRMLEFAKSALGNTYTGYKGGNFKMDEYTDCYIANYGECGETIGKLLLDYMTESI